MPGPRENRHGMGSAEKRAIALWISLPGACGGTRTDTMDIGPASTHDGDPRDAERAPSDAGTASDAASDAAAGTDTGPPVLEGFRTERLLGTGGSSSVWLIAAEDGRGRFALKVPLDAVQEPDAAGAALREFNLLSGFRHEHLLVAYGPVTTSKGTGMRMDYAPGGSLQNLIGVRGPLPVGEAVTVLAPIAQALASLHTRGAAHGDVSPGNILFTEEGKPLLGDFGLGRRLGEGGRSAAGTPGFRDPRGTEPGRLDTEADVFALAAVAWFVLTGRIPGPTVQRPPLSVLVPEVPPRFLELVEEGLSEEPDLRPDAASFARGLLRAASPVPVDLVDAVDESVRPGLLTRAAVQPETRHGAALRGLKGLAWVKNLRGRTAGAANRTRHARGGGTRQQEVRGGTRTVPPRRGRRAKPPGPGRAGGRAGAALAVLLILAGGAAWVGAAAGDRQADRLARHPESLTSEGPGTPGQPTPEASAPGPPGPGTSGRGTGAVQDAVEALPALAALRAEAFARADPALLARVNAAGSPAMEADSAQVTTLARAGGRLAGLRITIAAPRPVALPAPEGPGWDAVSTEAVAATAEVSAHTETDTSGRPVSAPAAPSRQELVFILRDDGGGWRIHSVHEPEPAPGRAPGG